MAKFKRYFDYNIMPYLYKNHNSKDEVNRINISRSKIYQKWLKINIFQINTQTF